MDTVLTPDICVIGAGAGGLTVAAAAAAFGVSVVLVEKGRMGGDCLNHGCVPSKALIAAARQAHLMRRGTAFGVAAVEPEIDFAGVMRHVGEVIASIAPNDSVERFHALGVKVIAAEARFAGPHSVMANGVEIRARRFVLATGSRPRIPAIPGLHDVPFLTNESVFGLKRRPRHLVVLGAGPVGVELAQAFRRLGSEVTVIDAGRALEREDPEQAGLVVEALRAEGVVLRENTTVERIELRGKTGVRLHVAADAAPLDGSHLLLATGREPNVDGLDLAAAGIDAGPAGIRVSPALRTGNRRVYAIGDVAGGGHTHVAGHHAGLVLRQILFRVPTRIRPQIIPRVIFSEPELAAVGIGEAEALAAHRGVRVLRWPYVENDRAQAERTTGGFVKLIVDRRGRLLGTSVVGPNAGEMINLHAFAVAHGMRAHDLATYVAPYPTMAEIGKRAAITYLADATRRPAVRWLLRMLRVFG